MLNRLRIAPRLILLISMQAMALLVIGWIAVTGLKTSGQSTEQLSKSMNEQISLSQMNDALRSELLGNLDNVLAGRMSWEQGRMDVHATKNLLLSLWDEYQADKSPAEILALGKTLARYQTNLNLVFDDLDKLLDGQDRSKLIAYQDTAFAQLTDPFINELNERAAEQQLHSEELFKTTLSRNAAYLYACIAAIVFGLALASVLGYFIYHSIARPIWVIEDTVNNAVNGDFYARTNLQGQDELSKLGRAFDHLLAERVTTLVQAEQENESLNAAVVTLLHAVSKLSRRDLTIKIPATDAVTGPIAAALNQFTDDTARVLIGVRRIAEQVAKASGIVRTQSDIVSAVAESEQSEIDETALTLAQAATKMNRVAGLVKVCDNAAEGAMSATRTALHTVTDTVQGINGIRTTIHETEKRIKRLGERSQDISRVINLINGIAERTHILALNASMHAASAGEAGRGFAVVAEEVQRLAENARDATQQIATLVANMQNETLDTVSTMNNVITRVVAGSRLAEQAGEHMLRARDSTEHLVESVRQIAKDTDDQILLSDELLGRAHSIQESTRKTRTQMEEQTQHTRRLVQYSKGLLSAVKVFTLPASVDTAAVEPVMGEEGSNISTPLQQRAS